MVSRIARVLGAMTDTVAREGEPDRLLVSADKNPNFQGARLTGVSFTEAGTRLPEIARGIEDGHVRTLVVLGEDVTKAGIAPELLARVGTLVVSDILPSATTAAAHVVLPGCAHVEKRGTFINGKGRVQRFQKAIEAPGDARAEWEWLLEVAVALGAVEPSRSIEGLFNRMASDVPALAGLQWAGLGDLGVSVPV